MSKITNIKHYDGHWSWELDGVSYATNLEGNGIFREDENGLYTIQVAGPCDFKACDSVLSVRQKVKAWFPDIED